MFWVLIFVKNCNFYCFFMKLLNKMKEFLSLLLEVISLSRVVVIVFWFLGTKRFKKKREVMESRLGILGL